MARDADEADFKKGSIGVKVVMGGLVVAALGGALVYVGVMREGRK